MRKVLQVNIRLSEGGAAGVARTLADELRQLGVNSPFAYGYGKGGKPSRLEKQYEGVRMTPRPIAALNRLSYGLVGRETRLFSPTLWSEFIKEVQESDVVHLHAIHSYFVSTERLFDALIAAGKPVVWTLHDQWIMTGRCAQPGECRRWETGCKACPNLAAYPPAIYDHAAERWQERYKAVSNLQSKLPTAIVACADWLGQEAAKAGLRNVEVIKNSVDREFWDATRAVHKNQNALPFRNLFMCRDLRDKLKVNWTLLDQISRLQNQQLTIVGDNPIELDTRIQHKPAIMNRVELAREMAAHDRLIFTSQVDYFPLTIAEALTAGLNVLALDSRAAREFERHPQVKIARDEQSLMTMAEVPPDHFKSDVDQISETDFFDPQRMTLEYMDVYRRISNS
jgi:putative colanic acid biosynthesis glycosyltransferase